MNRIFRSAIFYLVLIIAVVWVYNLYRASADRPTTLSSVNEFVEMVEGGEILSAKFLTKDEKVVGELAGGDGKYELFLVTDTLDDLSQIAIDSGVEVSADPQTGSVFLTALFQFLPIILIVGFFVFLMQ